VGHAVLHRHVVVLTLGHVMLTGRHVLLAWALYVVLARLGHVMLARMSRGYVVLTG